MLIDSHCHLDYLHRPNVPTCWRAPSGRRGRDGHDRHDARAIREPAGDHRGHAERLVHRRRASAPRGRGADPDAGGPRRADRTSAGDRHRRIRPRLFLRPGAARRSAGEFPRPYPRRPAGRGATGDPCAGRRRRHRAILQEEREPGRASHFLLHCFSSSRAWPRRRWRWAAMSASRAS